MLLKSFLQKFRDMCLKKMHIIKQYTRSPLIRKIKYENHEYRVWNTWFWDVFDKGWEPETFKIFKNIIKPETVFIDIGSYIGPTALMAADYGCKSIYCIEASITNIRVLRLNLFLNTLKLPKCITSNLCISDKSNESVQFGGNYLSTACSTRSKGKYVTSITIQDYIKDNNIQYDDLFIKIDVEGSEALVLNSLDLVLQEKGRINIFLSLHPPFINNKSLFIDKFKELFEKYKLFNSELKSITVSEIEEMFLSDEEKPSWGTEYGNFFEILIRNK